MLLSFLHLLKAGIFLYNNECLYVKVCNLGIKVMCVKFTSEFIEQVRQANNIVDVISGYVSLKRQGRNFWACCPFHNEKTASFSVTPDKGFFYCFGCHASGDVFKFIMMKENLSFGESVERLAERAHIALPEVSRSAEDEARDRHRDQLFKVNEMAGRFFHNCLTKTHYGTVGLDYFHGRHVTDETIHDFSLGFAPDSWNKLTDAFIKAGTASWLGKRSLCREPVRTTFTRRYSPACSPSLG